MKRGSLSNVGGMITDRISNLPDSLLFQVLSFLPTKYARRTTILSKRWKSLLASVPNLYFEFEGVSNPWKDDYLHQHILFLNYVRRVLLVRESSEIQSLHLHCFCRADDVSLIAQCIRIAISNNVVELRLLIKAVYTDADNFPMLDLPECVFMSKKLVGLKVKSNCITYFPPTSGCFPSLKCLDIKLICLYGDSMETLFTCCPVLEDLSIGGYVADTVYGDKASTLKIVSPKLKKLRLNLICDDDFVGGPNYSIVVNAPKLEDMDIKHDYLPMYSFENVHSLVKGSVDICCHFGEDEEYIFNRAPALLEPFSNVKYLSFSVHSLKEGCLPAFDKLRELKLVLRDCYYWDLLTELLKKSPILESIVIEHEEDQDCVDEYEMHQTYLEDVLYSEDRWSKPDVVPMCLVSHLQTLAFRGYSGYPH